MLPENLNVLYIDSRPEDLGIFSRMFQDACRVVHLGSTVDLQKALEERDIHVIIVADDIADQSGMDLLESICRNSPNAVKMVTGNDILGKEDVIEAQRTGKIFRYLAKPWNEDEIKVSMESALLWYAKCQEQSKTVTDLKRMLKDLDFLHEISRKISEKKPLPKLLNEIMLASRLVMNAEASSLLLYDREEDKLYFQVATGKKGSLVKKYSVDIGQGIAGWVAQHRQPLLIEDCYKDARFNQDYDKKTHFKTRSMLCVPLLRKNNLLGVVQVINKKGGGEFTETDLRIFETLAAQCAIAIENARLIQIQIEAEAMERELETARQIQQFLLPQTLPEFDDIQLAARLIPARQVGGDYYNVISIGEQQSLFFVADVTGKGIPAALIVSTIDSCLNTYLKIDTDRLDLLKLVSSMNMVLIESTTETRFATAWFGLYHHKKRIMQSVNAGHNAPVLYREKSGEMILLQQGGLFLGGLEVPYEMEEIALDTGDVLVFFTDGVTEAWNRKQDEYGDERLQQVIRRNVSKSAEDILQAIAKDVKEHVGKAQQSDDFTCAVIKVI
ncbi:hypothetical protein A2V82_12685 [candidate division KSB1 bacterium RBG_16_48_16]|nr:MAG: hypothetical protein A2V82_12685 [candidate division KSB1 bacterium RBG_16_48_16]